MVYLDKIKVPFVNQILEINARLLQLAMWEVYGRTSPYGIDWQFVRLHRDQWTCKNPYKIYMYLCITDTSAMRTGSSEWVFSNELIKDCKSLPNFWSYYLYKKRFPVQWPGILLTKQARKIQFTHRYFWDPHILAMVSYQVLQKLHIFLRYT